ncbi:MAG TPA: hypothetical protein PLQ35_02195 [bacterium]|nr:hypothetical protein [bacterium]HQL61083.1 hypothetical protein [bacterium]
MIQAIKETVRIQPGGVIEIRRPQLPEGALAEVIVMLESDTPIRDAVSSVPRLTDFFGACKGLFASATEADGFIRELREEWERPWYPRND